MIAKFSVSLVFLAFFLTHQVVAAGRAESAVTDAVLAWSESSSLDERVFVATLSEGEWSSPVQLSENDKLSFHPSAGINQKGELWVVWSSVDNGKTNLYYTVKRNGRWLSQQLYNTGLSNNKSAVLIFDSNSHPIIVWTAIEEKYPDIFWAINENGEWSNPEKIHSANDVPDIEPRLYRDQNGVITVEWKTIKNGKYTSSTAIYTNNKWVLEKMSEVSADMKSESRRADRNIPQLPKFEFIKDSRKANLYIRDNGRSMNTPALPE